MLYNKCKVGYIRHDCNIYEKAKEKFMKFFRKISIKVYFEIIENGVIISIPKYKNYNNFIKKILINQINTFINNNGINYLVFEENLEYLKQYFDKSIILNGKYFMKNSVIKLLEYIFNINNKNMNLENIYIFVNEYSKTNICIIEKLITKFKTVNIITENLRYYRRLENSLYKEGILITVSSNKRKSARNAKYIINMDFEKENIEKYSINRGSIIINLTNEIQLLEKSFNGIIINSFKVNVNNNNKDFIDEFYGHIDNKIYLESCLLNFKDSYVKYENLYNQYECNICELVGVRGIISRNEFLM